MISFSDLCIMREARVLIEHASCTVFPGQKVGVIGRNGCGKSSLFAVLKGELAPESGTLAIPKDLKISAVSQQTPALSKSAREYVIDGDRELRELQKQRELALSRNDGEQLALLEDKLGIAGQWTVNSRVEELLHGLGFSEEEMDKPVRDFSGGWRMRLNLAQALIAPHDLLLLDEPTNHLDLDTILFLENYLMRSQATILCISHDRDFLDTFCDHMLHFESGHLVLYTGNYSAYEKIRAERIKAEKASRKKEEAALSHMQAFVERFRYKASKARQAQSLIKAIDRLKLTAVTQEESPFSFSFPEPDRTVEVLCDLKDVSLGYSQEKQILSKVNRMLIAGDRVGLLGRNGQGKSTFIKALVGILKPQHGTITIGKDLKIGYFAQHELESLMPELTPLEHLHRLDPKANENTLRSFLGSFAFSGELALKQVKTLSGGEQARLALALIAFEKPNLLLLDEPTNHLDLEMREALSIALASYPGALILVSHDRHLLEAIASTFWLVDNGTVRDFDGDLEDYRNYLNEQNRAFMAAHKEKQGSEQTVRLVNFKSREQKRQEAQFRQQLKPLKEQLSKLEKQLEKMQAELAQIDAELSSPELYDDKARVEELLKSRARLTALTENTETEWLEKQAELEDLQANPS
ncbi:MAG: ATP-binding cassette domain-containing protein [Succinivibrio sp.]|nr:ATP-binding cassette domain-containing protein [Succinivibrio sp.]